MNRILRRVMVAVRKPWHMYPVGVLFGFGFDTATEISLLVLASTGAAFVLPWYAILCLPILFMAGMCLFDTMDGSFMNFAYGWAFSQPVRKVYYNITITSLSVIVAVLIGGIELLGLLADKFELTGGVWNLVGAAGDYQYTGYLVVGVFVAHLGGLAAHLALRPNRGEVDEPARDRPRVMPGSQKSVAHHGAIAVPNIVSARSTAPGVISSTCPASSWARRLTPPR